mmetsp:Transcript_8756/g.20251  ORF Transcript_8756/g.20251 Transcript_8756/m.20251 type:complete len:142 (-) Transcript_8756:178-603(-)
MTNCHDDHDLCDISVLLARLKPFARYNRDMCMSSTPSSTSPSNGNTNPTSSLQMAKHVLQTPTGIFLILLLILASAGMGSLLTIWHVLGYNVLCGKNRRRVMEEERDGLQRANPYSDFLTEPIEDQDDDGEPVGGSRIIVA